VVPEFVIEVRSDSDAIGRLQTKMREVWIANGVRLAWLIDPKNQVTYIHRADGSEQVIAGFDRVLSGEDVLPGFELQLSVLEV
jgi:Uma2 family endonuclease